MKSPNILLVDDLGRIGLAVMRALKMGHNYNIQIVTRSKGHLMNSILRRLKSNTVNSIHYVESPYHDISSVEKIIGIIKRYNIDLVVPTGHAPTIAISKFKRELSDFVRVAVEDYDKIMKFHDKKNTVLLARELDIPHPLTTFPQNLDEVKTIAKTNNYPIVIKARIGSAASGVWYAQNAEQLLNIYKKASQKGNLEDTLLKDSSQPMFQEYISGELHDVAAFCVNGKMEVGFTQQRVMTKPLSGGMGIVDITTTNDEILNYARKIVSHTRWNGVLLFDFKIDKYSGIPKLLEINPRFWGATWLSLAAGLNYPHYLVSNALNLPFEYNRNYKVGLICRWPFLELDTILERPVTLTSAFKRIIEFISRFFYKNCVYDILLSDIRPTIAEILQRLLHLGFRIRRVIKQVLT